MDVNLAYRVTCITKKLIPSKKEYEARVDIHYLLGVINSSYIAFAYNKLVREAGRVFPQVKITHVKKLPLAIPLKQKQDEIAMKVEEVLDTKRKNANADTSILEHEIDHLVYVLYGLTAEEIKIVEESAPSTSRLAEPAPDSPPLA